jgi:peroxiredoxin
MRDAEGADFPWKPLTPLELLAKHPMIVSHGEGEARTPVSLEELRARTDYLLFYCSASWCPPCQQETPVLRALAAAYRDRGLQVIGISVGELPSTVAAYAERYELGYLLLVDVNSELFRAAGAGGIPTKLILDADGRVLRVVTGPLTSEAATALVEELLPTR